MISLVLLPQNTFFFLSLSTPFVCLVNQFKCVLFVNLSKICPLFDCIRFCVIYSLNMKKSTLLSQSHCSRKYFMFDCRKYFMFDCFKYFCMCFCFNMSRCLAIRFVFIYSFLCRSQLFQFKLFPLNRVI